MASQNTSGVSDADLCALPDIAGSFFVLTDDREDTRCDDAVGTAEVVVDF
jgi:hypothetical protein